MQKWSNVPLANSPFPKKNLRDNSFTQTLWEVSHQPAAFMHLCSVVFVVLGAVVLNSYFDNDPLVNYDDIVVK